MLPLISIKYQNSNSNSEIPYNNISRENVHGQSITEAYQHLRSTIRRVHRWSKIQDLTEKWAHLARGRFEVSANDETRSNCSNQRHDRQSVLGFGDQLPVSS